MLFIMSMSVVIALVLKQVFGKYAVRWRAIIYALFLVAIIGEYRFPMHFSPAPQTKDFPTVYTWLATTKPNTKIIELPIYNWNMFPFSFAEQRREYYSTMHFRKTVNGGTGFSPPPWQELMTRITFDFPSPATNRKLRQLGVDYIIVHTDEYDAYSKTVVCGHKGANNGKEIIRKIEKSQTFRLEKEFKDTYVFAFR